MMQVIKYPSKKDWGVLLKRPLQDYSLIRPHVQSIIDDVKKRGDEAVAHYTKQFDNVALKNFQLQPDEWDAEETINHVLKEAINLAIKNIRVFHESQSEDVRKIETMPGISCWRKSVPIEKIGLYIPGGTAPLFSTLLMLAVPAMIAGCKEIIVCTPPQKD